MKRGIGMVLFIVWLSSFCLGVRAAAETWLYTDPKTQVTFSVPANWKQEEMSQERQYLDAKFVCVEGGSVLIYGSVDLWEKLPAQDKIGKTRAQINNSLFTETEIAEMIGVLPDKVETVTYGRATYFQTIIPTTQPLISTTQLACIHNGWLYTFQYSTTSSRYEEIKTVLESVQYPGGPPSATVGGRAASRANGPLPFIGMLMVSLLITVSVYTVPVLIYRFGIRKAPLPPAKAKKFTVIYGILAFLAMSVLLFLLNGEAAASSAILLWSMVNYKILTSGRGADFPDVPVQENRPMDPSGPVAWEECEAPHTESASVGEDLPPGDPDAFKRRSENGSLFDVCGEQATREDEEMTCPGCDRAIPGDSRFCPYCRHPMVSEQGVPSEPACVVASHLEKAEAAYRGYREESVGTLFPGGVTQAANIITTLAGVLQLDLSQCDVLRYSRILSLYTYVQIRGTMHSDLLRIVQGLQADHADLIQSERKAREVLAACIVHAQHIGFTLSSESNWQAISSLADYIGQSAADSESNRQAASAHIEDPAYGLVPNKPIFTRGVRGSQEYLCGLVTVAGEPLQWNRRGSIGVQGIQGMVDVYDSYLPSGQAYQTLYICMCAQTNSRQAPLGFQWRRGRSGPAGPVAEEAAMAVPTCLRCGADLNAAGKCPICRKRRRRLGWGISLGCLLIAAAAVLVGIFVVKPAIAYQRAENHLEAGQYDEAYAGFCALGTYRDAAVMAKEARYQKALLLLEEKKYTEANPILQELGDYKDSASRIHYHHHILFEEKEPTCTEEGFYHYLCEGCGDNYFVTREPKGHRYGEATCTKAAVCSVCKKTIRKALGHTTEYNKCQRCNKVLFQKKTYSGTGPRRITDVKLPRGSYWVTLDFIGESNFVVWLYGDNPDMASSLLANTIGSHYLYGPVWVENRPVEKGCIDVVMAQGSWTITVEAN